MIEWLERKVGRVGHAFSTFPVLKWRSMFFIFLFLIAIVLYQPLVVLLYKFNIMGMFIFQDFIQQNARWFIWGQVFFPLVVAVWGYFDVIFLYEEKLIKKYGKLPKWVN